MSSKNEDVIPRCNLLTTIQKKGDKISWKKESSLPYVKEARENAQANLVSSKISEVFYWRHNNTSLYRKYYLFHCNLKYYLFKTHPTNRS
jgi:hypothetical protein